MTDLPVTLSHTPPSQDAALIASVAAAAIARGRGGQRYVFETVLAMKPVLLQRGWAAEDVGPELRDTHDAVNAAIRTQRGLPPIPRPEREVHVADWPCQDRPRRGARPGSIWS